MSDRSEFEELCCVAGLTTLVWSYAENGLAFMLNDIIENTGPIKGHAEAPLSLKRKIVCFKTALREVPALNVLQHDGRALASRFGKLGKRRNDFAHSAAFNLADGGFDAVTLRPHGGKYAIHNQRVDVADAVLLNVEIAEFCEQVTSFMARLDAIFA